MKNLKGSIILLIAAFFWGTTFVAQTMGAGKVGTFTFNASRCVIGSTFLLIVSLIRDTWIKHKNTDNKPISVTVANNTTAPPYNTKAEAHVTSKWPLVPGIICGTVVFLAMTTQQAGLSFYPDDAAASGRAGFLTATYVVMVAVIEQLVLLINKKKGKTTDEGLSIIVMLSVLITVIGMYLLCVGKGGFTSLYVGDIIEFGCAFCFTAHILVVDKYNNTDSIKLSCIQFATCMLLSVIGGLISHESVNLNNVQLALPAILYAGILSSGVAYTCQMIGQKYAKPAVASIVMSLESVFAVISGAIVLKEVMNGREILGCILVFSAVILAQIPGFIKK